MLIFYLFPLLGSDDEGPETMTISKSEKEIHVSQSK